MNTTVRTNAMDLAKRMGKRASSVMRNLEIAAQILAADFERETHRIIKQEIYAIPVPRAARSRIGARPKYKRTGELLRSETAISIELDVVLRNTSPHAKPRAAMGLPGHKPITSPGIRSVQWQPKAVNSLRRKVIEFRKLAIHRALKSP